MFKRSMKNIKIHEELCNIVQELQPYPIVIITNNTLGQLYKERLLKSFETFTVLGYIEIKDGEQHKTFETYEKLSNDILDLPNVDRSTILIAFGGGVTTDIVGFTASTLLRGIKYVNIPTSLLAMVDASIGNKTGINTKHGKNLIGTFHSPILTYIALDVLDTLPEDEYINAFGEIIKCALIDYRGRDFINWLKDDTVRQSLFERNKHMLRQLINDCIIMKHYYIGTDSDVHINRECLNVGHTFGHMIEQYSNYTIPHGQAVAIGIVKELQLSTSRKFIEKSQATRIKNLLESYKLNVDVNDPKYQIDLDSAKKIVQHDKKWNNGLCHVPLIVEYAGPVRCFPITLEELCKEFVNDK